MISQNNIGYIEKEGIYMNPIIKHVLIFSLPWGIYLSERDVLAQGDGM